MKRLISLSIALSLLAFVSSVYACGENNASGKASTKASCCAKSANVSTSQSQSDNVQIKTAKVVGAGAGSNCLMGNKTSADKNCGMKSTKTAASSEKAEVKVLEKDAGQKTTLQLKTEKPGKSMVKAKVDKEVVK